jgi:superfamily I DNA/RNA helicase
MRRQVARVLSRLIGTEGLDSSEIIVLTPRSLDGSALLSEPLDSHLRLIPDTPTSNRQVQVSTVHRFKGLERPVVVLTEIDELNGVEREAIMYVALSRPRSYLIVIAKSELADQLASLEAQT